MRSDFPGWSKVHLFMTKHIYSVGSTVVNPKPVSESPAHDQGPESNQKNFSLMVYLDGAKIYFSLG